jgi:hypothetical protein
MKRQFAQDEEQDERQEQKSSHDRLQVGEMLFKCY